MKEETRKLLEKASRSIRVSEIMLREGEEDFAASRAYYAMFYVADALLREKGIRNLKNIVLFIPSSENCIPKQIY